MKVNTVAAADVLWSPDKTTQLVVENSTLCVLSLSLSPSFRFRLFLSSNDPSRFSSCKRIYVSIWPQPKSIIVAFCLKQSHRRAVVECGAHGPRQIELNALLGCKEAQLL